MREPKVVVSEKIFPAPVVCDRFRREFAWRLVSPLVARLVYHINLNKSNTP